MSLGFGGEFSSNFFAELLARLTAWGAGLASKGKMGEAVSGLTQAATTATDQARAAIVNERGRLEMLHRTTRAAWTRKVWRPNPRYQVGYEVMHPNLATCLTNNNTIRHYHPDTNWDDEYIQNQYDSRLFDLLWRVPRRRQDLIAERFVKAKEELGSISLSGKMSDEERRRRQDHRAKLEKEISELKSQKLSDDELLDEILLRLDVVLADDERMCRFNPAQFYAMLDAFEKENPTKMFKRILNAFAPVAGKAADVLHSINEGLDRHLARKPAGLFSLFKSQEER